MIRLLLVDDQLLVRRGLKVLLEAQPHLQVIGEAEDGQMAIEKTQELCPDVVLMDVRMPGMSGVTATQLIMQQMPGTKILMLSTFDDDQYVVQAIRWGAKGYLLKDTDPQELAQAIAAVNQGYTQLAPGLAEKAIAPLLPQSRPVPLPPELAQLTARERQILCLIIAGASNRQIAQKLFISEGTVKNHITHILKRLNVSDRVQAIMFASDFLSYLSGGC